MLVDGVSITRCAVECLLLVSMELMPIFRYASYFEIVNMVIDVYQYAAHFYTE